VLRSGVQKSTVARATGGANANEFARAGDLDLLPIAGRYVGYGPADFLAYRLLQVGTQQMQQTRQNAAAEYQLRLNVVARHDVTHGPQCGCHYTRRLVPAQPSC